MGSIFSSYPKAKEEDYNEDLEECQEEDDWHLVDHEDLEDLEEEQEEEEEEEEEEDGSTLPEPHNTYTLLPPYLTRIIIPGLGLLDCLALLRWSTGLASMEWSSPRPSCRLGKELLKSMGLRMNINLLCFLKKNLLQFGPKGTIKQYQ